MGDNGSNGASCEAILPLMQDGTMTQGYGGSLFYIAALWNDAMKSVTGKDAGTTENAWSGMRVRPSFLKVFFNNPSVVVKKEAKDIRAMNIDDRAIFWGKGNDKNDRTLELGENKSFFSGIVTPKWNNNYAEGGTPHDSKFVDTDFFLFRVAEAYLNAAEAEMHLNGEGSDKAKGYIDKLRERAHADVHSSYTLNDVLDERARELFMEEWRNVELKRVSLCLARSGRPDEWGNTYSLDTFDKQEGTDAEGGSYWYQRLSHLSMYNKGEIHIVSSGQPNVNYRISKHNMYWPIPEDAIVGNNKGVLHQNFGYTGYDPNVEEFDTWEEAVADEQ